MVAQGFFLVNRRMLIGTVIGAVLFTVMSRFVMLPTPIQGTYFFPSYALLGLFATLFGPISGALISLAGMVLVGLWRASFDIARWTAEYFSVSYTIAAIACGYIYGFAKNYAHDADQGKFGFEGMMAYNVAQITGNIAAWGLLASVLELIFSSNRTAAEIFLQGFTAAFVNILSAEFIGTPLLLGYVYIRKRQLAGKTAAKK